MHDRRRYEIPAASLPEGFAERLEAPPDPPTPAAAAATVVLVRPALGGLEVLLLERNRTSGFVPGAYVFPGGRVEPADGAAALLARARGLSPERASRRLGLAPEERPPALAYYLAGVREAFEETGILLARRDDGSAPPTSSGSDRMEVLRTALLDDRITLLEVLEASRSVVDLDALCYIAHWVTPEAEPRRYDTRFFSAAVGPGVKVRIDPREMVDGVWATPEEAVARHRTGDFPMVFPTIRTLEALVGFETPGELQEHFRRREIPRILPRLVRTEGGVAIQVPEGET